MTATIEQAKVARRLASARLQRMNTVRPAWWGVLGLALVTVAFSTSSEAYYLFIFNSVLLACLGAISLNVLMGTAGQVSIGNAAFLLVGGFATVIFMRAGVPFGLDIALATVVSALLGILAGLPALRLRSLFLALSTMAVFFIALFVANLYQAKSGLEYAGGFWLEPLFTSGGLLGAQRRWAWILFAAVAILILLASRVMQERSGRALRMIRDHELVAPTLGIDVARYKLVIFGLSSAVIGFQGAMTAYFSGLVSADNYTLYLAVQYIAMVLIGGLDSILGAVMGATIIVALPTLVPKVIDNIVDAGRAAAVGPQVSQILYGVLIIVFVTMSHEGLVGWLRAVRDALFRRAPR